MSIFRRLVEEKMNLPSPDRALPGRAEAMPIVGGHAVLGTPLQGPWPDDCECIVFGMGCFWGAEKIFWQLEGVYSTAVGYAAGFTPNPTYKEVCSGLTGHNEVVLVVYHPEQISLAQLLTIFWEGHDPTQGMRQGNDQGTQYRSGVYTFDEVLLAEAKSSLEQYQGAWQAQGKSITTELQLIEDFFYAEDYHQQYLAKNPDGYCGLIPIDQSDRPRFPS